MPDLKEADIQSAICDYLDSIDVTEMAEAITLPFRASAVGFRWRVSVAALPVHGGKASRANPLAGHPDIACIVGGKYIAIEVKTATGRMSEKQIAWQIRLIAAGGLHIIARNVDDVRKILAPLVKAA